MRIISTLALLMCLAACSAMMVGGGTSGGAPPLGSDTRSTSQAATDSALQQSVQSALAADEVLPAVQVSARNGAVTLSGAVSSFALRDRIVAIARNTDGVASVNNQIRVNTNPQ